MKIYDHCIANKKKQMDKEIYIQEDIGLAKSCLKCDSNEEIIERVKYFLSHCRNGMLTIAIKTPKEVAEE